MTAYKSDPIWIVSTATSPSGATVPSSVMAATGTGPAGSVISTTCRPSSEAEATTAYKPDPAAKVSTSYAPASATVPSSVMAATGTGPAGSVRLSICRPSSEAEAMAAYKLDPIRIISTAEAPPRTVAPSSATDDMTLGL